MQHDSAVYVVPAAPTWAVSCASCDSASKAAASAGAGSGASDSCWYRSRKAPSPAGRHSNTEGQSAQQVVGMRLCPIGCNLGWTSVQGSSPYTAGLVCAGGGTHCMMLQDTSTPSPLAVCKRTPRWDRHTMLTMLCPACERVNLLLVALQQRRHCRDILAVGCCSCAALELPRGICQLLAVGC